MKYMYFNSVYLNKTDDEIYEKYYNYFIKLDSRCKIVCTKIGTPLKIPNRYSVSIVDQQLTIYITFNNMIYLADIEHFEDLTINDATLIDITNLHLEITNTGNVSIVTNEELIECSYECGKQLLKSCRKISIDTDSLAKFINSNELFNPNIGYTLIINQGTDNFVNLYDLQKLKINKITFNSNIDLLNTLTVSICKIKAHSNYELNNFIKYNLYKIKYDELIIDTYDCDFTKISNLDNIRIIIRTRITDELYEKLVEFNKISFILNISNRSEFYKSYYTGMLAKLYELDNVRVKGHVNYTMSLYDYIKNKIDYKLTDDFDEHSDEMSECSGCAYCEDIFWD